MTDPVGQDDPLVVEDPQVEEDSGSGNRDFSFTIAGAELAAADLYACG